VSRFSQRLPPDAERNATSRELDRLAAAGTPIVDLTESNPTRVGLDYPADLLAALSGPEGLVYEPQPLGTRRARQAVAADCARRGARVDPGDVVLTASSSESYAWLFKLLCNPGDAVLAPRPSYPLFEHLTRLEAVRLVSYDVDYHGEWRFDFDSIAQAPADTRAVLVVSPNNPTGSYIDSADLDLLQTICRDRGWAIIADEVFADYPLDAAAPVTDIAGRADVLAFSLGGASKALGLPQVKLGWIVAGGPAAGRAAALNALEFIADTYLSVSTAVQIAAPDLLERGAGVRRQIQSRVRENLTCARALAARYPACEVLAAGGGWSAVVRVPSIRSEEDLVLELLRRERILVHPGFFFDFPRESFVVVSLLPQPDIFADAMTRLLSVASS
jgi:aspartate/methionine/tyrosine aminotransferase